MSDWNILITDHLEEAGLATLRQAAQVVDRDGISAQELPDIISDFHAVIVRSRTKITAALLEAASRLKVIGRAGVGIDNIDLQAAQKRGVIVVNTPAATSLAVAELTIGLLFALARQIPRLDAALKDGQWLKNEITGIELNGKTLGILGLGNIGLTVARYAHNLEMCILGYDPFLSPQEINQRQAQPVSLTELYTRSDFISLHLPLNPETRSLIGREAIQKMKSGVYLICTARGGVIEEAALLEALHSGQVAGAALDVYAQEPPGNMALLRHPNLIATPHIGAQTKEAQRRAAEQIAHEVLAALNGKTLHWRLA